MINTNTLMKVYVTQFLVPSQLQGFFLFSDHANYRTRTVVVKSGICSFFNEPQASEGCADA